MTNAPAGFRENKALIGVACQRLIDDILKPRFLPQIRPTQFNYPIDIRGRWHGASYRFIQRYRVNPPDPELSEFDAPFARLTYLARDRFELSFRRHTEQWWPLYRGVGLEKALALMVEDGLLHPL